MTIRYTCLFCMWLLLSACTTDQFNLSRFSVPKDGAIVKLDSFKDGSLGIYSVTRYKALGKMEIHFVVANDSMLSKNSVFKIENNKGGLRISRDFIAITKSYGVKNWGWFQLNSGTIDNQLPAISNLMDSLSLNYGNGYFVTQSNGLIDVMQKGQTIVSHDYGDLLYDSVISGSTNIFPGVYKVKDNQLVLLSPDADDLFTQNDGLYYVPPPGYGVIKSVKKELLYRSVDSVLKLTPIPRQVEIYPERAFSCLCIRVILPHKFLYPRVN
jgi:hypothetical protein